MFARRAPGALLLAKFLHYVHTAHAKAGILLTQEYPVACLVARRSSKAHMRTTKLPSTWLSTVVMDKPLSLVKYNYAKACKMHTCSSGKCHTRIYDQDHGHTIGNKHRHHFPPLQWLPPPVPIQTLAHEAKVHRVDT